MTDDENFSSDLLDAPPIDDALADIERAMLRLEHILTRHGQVLQKAASRRKRIGSALQLFDILLGKGQKIQGFEKNPTRSNRFPTSGGQFLADLASSIRIIGGRNL